MANRERLLSTLIDLIRIDSPSGEEDAIDLELSTRLKALGCQIQHDSFNNIVAKLPGNHHGSSAKPVILSAHMDTVDPGRGIKPVIDGDSLRSDGTTILGGDCKAGLTIVLEALASVKESGGNRRPVEVAFTRHEEGGLVGAHHLDFGLLSAKEGMVFDGEGPVNRITVAAPSQNVVTANIKGRAAHAGLEPENGISAILIAAEVLGLLPLGRIDFETTSNIGRMEAGLKRNIIPEEAFLDGEIRSRDNAKLDHYSEAFRQVFEETSARHPQAQISLDITNTYQAYDIDGKHPAITTIARACKAIGLTPQMEASGGGSDANVFIEKGIVAVPVGIGVQSFHTTWETADIPLMLQGAQMCEKVIRGV